MNTPIHEFRGTLLKVSDVSVAFDRMPILRDVNLEIRDVYRPGKEQGQVVGLLGPSGVGKTTLFRVLAGLAEPDTGTVLIEEEGRPVHRGMVGVVAQDYPLFAHRTVLGNLTVAARSAGLSRLAATQKARALLEQFGLTEHETRYPIQLSGGQRQRIAIAQQFMCSDHFLLMDEPFSGLDLIAIQRVCAFIRDIVSADELKTIIVVTHDIVALLAVADTIWLLGRDRDKDGKIIPGARIQSTYNLIERGLAWQDSIDDTPEFMETLREIRTDFQRL